MRAATLDTYKERILKVLLYIQEHLDDDLPIEHLADVAHFSMYHFHRVFKGLVGETVKDHIRRLRMERAAFQLIHTAERVTDVAFAAGYDSLEAFSRRFREDFHVSPSAFREMHAEAWKISKESNIHWREGLCEEHLEGSSTRFDSSTVRTERLEPRTVALVRHIGPYENALNAWQSLFEVIDIGSSQRKTDPFGICYDDPAITDRSKLRYDACVEVDDDFTPTGEVGKSSLKGGLYAVYAHRGSYEPLQAVYDLLLGQWLPTSGYEVRDIPCMEFYRISAIDGALPDDWVTEIYVPLADTMSWV